MNNVATQIWNEIAKEQPLETEAASVAFSLTPRHMEVLDANWGKGLPNKVALGLQLVTPLLMERKAIRAYLAVPGRSMLRGVFPEINTAQEAAQLAAMELWLSPSETDQLKALLEGPQGNYLWLKAATAAAQAR